MESILTEFFGNILKELADHVLAYLGIGAAAVATAGYAINLRYKKSVVESESNQNNEGQIMAGDDVVNGNQTNNYYYTQPPSKTAEPNSSEYKQEPGPNEIVEAVEKLPVADQHEAQRKYLGQNFQWKVKFHKLKKKEGDADQFRVFFSDPDEFGKPMIYCDLRLKDHPQLQTLKEGESLTVAGKLNCFTGREMSLDLAQVDYSHQK